MPSGQYLTYEEYASYGGTEIAESDFTLREFEVRKRIDYLTDSRVKAMRAVPEAVKLCEMSMLKILGAAGVEAQIDNPTVTEFNTDGYSEKYGYAIGVTGAESAVQRTVKNYLHGEFDDYGVPLLYRGLNAPQYTEHTASSDGTPANLTLDGTANLVVNLG